MLISNSELLWNCSIDRFIAAIFKTQELLVHATRAEVCIRLGTYNANNLHLRPDGIYVNNVSKYAKNDLRSELSRKIKLYWQDVTDNTAHCGFDEKNCIIEFPDFKIEYVAFELCASDNVKAKPFFEHINDINQAFNKVVKVYHKLFE